MLLDIHLLAHCVHCPCCSTVMTLLGATAITQTANFFDAIERNGHRTSMEHERGQREKRMHSLLMWIRCLCCFAQCYERSRSPTSTGRAFLLSGRIVLCNAN